MTEDWVAHTKSPGCLVFLVEQSEELAKRGASGFSLSFEMKRIVDITINELLSRNNKQGEVAPRIKVGVFGYSNSHFSWCSTLRQETSGLKMISDEFRSEVEEEYFVEDLEVYCPHLFTEHLRGNGDVASGIFNLIEVVQRFVVEHPESPPPVVYHLFHSEVQQAQKKNVLSAMEDLKSIATSRGNALLFNIRLNPDAKETQVFPYQFSELNDFSDVIIMEGSSHLPLSLQEKFNWYGHHGNFYDYNIERKSFISASEMMLPLRLADIFGFPGSWMVTIDETALAKRGFFF